MTNLKKKKTFMSLGKKKKDLFIFEVSTDLNLLLAPLVILSMLFIFNQKAVYI